MQIRGRVIDVTNLEPLQGASITVVDAAGNYLGAGTATDAAGLFLLTSDKIEGNKILISNVGYSAVLYEPSLLTQDLDISLSPGASELPEVVVTASKKNKWIFPVVVLAGMVYLLKDEIKKAVK